MIKLSRYATAKSQSASMISIACWKIVGATFIPKGSRLNSYNSLCVFKVLNSEHLFSIWIYKYALKKSRFENILPTFNFEKISTGLGKGFLNYCLILSSNARKYEFYYFSFYIHRWCSPFWMVIFFLLLTSTSYAFRRALSMGNVSAFFVVVHKKWSVEDV